MISGREEMRRVPVERRRRSEARGLVGFGPEAVVFFEFFRIFGERKKSISYRSSHREIQVKAQGSESGVA